MPPPGPGAVNRRTAVLGSLFSLAACGGGGGGGPAPPPPPAVDGPAWFGFARNAQHSALGSEIATQPLSALRWSTPVDLAPPYNANGSLLAHYGSPVITRRNTVIVPVKLDSAGTFRVEARAGWDGSLLWTLDTSYRLPAARWVPSMNPVLTPDLRVLVPASGGRVIERASADDPSGAVRTIVFYGQAAYNASPAAHDIAVFINTPLTSDSQGNVFFGFSVTGANPSGLVGGFVRLGADGSLRWAGAAAVAGDAAMVKPATNSAPALSNDERTLYVVVNEAVATNVRARGRLVALDAVTLAPRAAAPLIDPQSGTPAWVSDDATSSPTVGPDGDVFIGVLEASGLTHNFRGWLLHFDATLAQVRTPGSFGWDNTPSIVPRAMVPQYTGASSYLLALKYNSYGGVGTGDGLHRVAIVDPNAVQPDRFAPAVSVMREVITVLGPTPDPDYPGGVEEWCINTAAVDPLTNSVLMNSEDGNLYRWHLPSNTLAERIRMNNGYAQAYTPTAIGPDGRVYAVNNARLFSIGQ